jgi:pseudaminic acid cytidylyltransferase
LKSPDSQGKVALIPARGGSRRIPGKNKREFHGRPMIAWSIAAAQSSGLFEEILVSTDDDDIAVIAEKHGAVAPFRRPAALSNDHAGTDPVILHALNWLASEGRGPKYLCCIYPTAPLLTGSVITEVFSAMQEGQAHSAFTATTFAHPVWRALRRKNNGCVDYQWPEHRATRSQDLPELIHDAGQCYWVEVAAYHRDPRLINDRSIPVVLPRWQVQDIDTEEDWAMAERLFTLQQSNEK